ncbi:MAG TPA: 1,4-alpha-glucan branching protein domain-containing protein [Planctomycetota bacterium]|nr:1,4-alpha-glucan branching protein domain-containing protein [Planctomycetota bacterium]
MTRRETTSESRAYLALLLHAHLPYIRNPDHERFLEENWFYEAVIETYLPLLGVFEGLVKDGVDFRLAMTLSPTVVSMFDDDLLRRRCERKLEGLIDLAEKEVIRYRHHPHYHETAVFYRDRFVRMREQYVKALGRDLTAAFRRLQDMGRLEIVASAATHAFLPLLRHEPSAVRAQVEVGAEHYRRRFGRDPQGMWLPECAYYPGLDEVLAEVGIRYFVLEAHGLLRGSTRPRHGLYAPVVCPSGVAAFGRDPECSKQVWSSREGFPGDPVYREFYWDLGYEMPLDYIGPYIGPDGIRVQTGMKYNRVTGRTDQKEPYVRSSAIARAAEHAGQFLEWRIKQARWARSRMDRTPIIVAPYDAELFGHWWFEGPEWLDFLLRKTAFDQDEVITITPSEYLAEYPDAQVSVPSASSWGAKGYNDVWLNNTNDWVHPKILRASGEMARTAFQNAGSNGTRRRVLNQAARELLLAQASDWTFILRSNTAAKYAGERVNEHLGHFEEVLGWLRDAPPGGQPRVDEARLSWMERRNNIFPDLEFEVFEERLPRPAFAVPVNPRHVVFITAEAVPYVKVGGLADVAGALPAALADLGVRVTVILPAYGTIDRPKHGIQPLKEGLTAGLGLRPVPFGLLEARSPAPGVRVLFVDEPGYFARGGVYVDPKSGKEYPDTADRFVFFTRAALEALRVLGDPVDVIHCHDHQTALGPAYLKLHHRKDPVLGLAASVYTLHNLGYQGTYGPEILGLAGFGPELFRPGSPFEHEGRVNFMKLGIHFADRVNTVSEGYAREIRAEESLGAGLRDALRARRGDFLGILNGIDVDEWNPAKDKYLPAPYDAVDLAGKRTSKEALFADAGLDPVHIEKPLAGMITRLVDQKGLDLVHASLEKILDLGVNVVVLGTGLPKYEAFFEAAAKEYPGRVAALLKFDNRMAHLIEAGADMFLMPSLYEPCGLNQMYSLRYGTVPVVRATGGLADTVTDDDHTPGGGVGFSFDEYLPEALLDAMARAVRAFRDPERWRRIVRAGMHGDNSWSASAAKYVDLYRGALAARE